MRHDVPMLFGIAFWKVNAPGFHTRIGNEMMRPSNPQAEAFTSDSKRFQFGLPHQFLQLQLESDEERRKGASKVERHVHGEDKSPIYVGQKTESAPHFYPLLLPAFYFPTCFLDSMNVLIK
jgi:hypothetical protein